MRVSIITVNLNNANGLLKTINSVNSQKYTDFEYIIIDGCSKDGSLEIIKNSAKEFTSWISEPDEGIYNAMNKGIIKSRGEYCLFLNSGDIFTAPDVLETLFSNPFFDDIAYGNFIIEKNGIGQMIKQPSSYTFYDFYVGTICHQSALIRRDLFKKVGLYNENLKIVSDWEFFLKAIFIHKCTTHYFNETIVNVEGEGFSTNFYDLYKNERLSVLEELFPEFIDDYKKLKDILDNNSVIYSKNKLIKFLVNIANFLIAKRRIIRSKL